MTERELKITKQKMGVIIISPCSENQTGYHVKKHCWNELSSLDITSEISCHC